MGLGTVESEAVTRWRSPRKLGRLEICSKRDSLFTNSLSELLPQSLTSPFSLIAIFCLYVPVWLHNNKTRHRLFLFAVYQSLPMTLAWLATFTSSRFLQSFHARRLHFSALSSRSHVTASTIAASRDFRGTGDFWSTIFLSEPIMHVILFCFSLF